MRYFLRRQLLLLFFILVNVVKVIANDESFISQVTLANSPSQLLLDEEQNKLYSLSASKGNLTVLDITTNQIQKIISINNSCLYITQNKQTNKLYVFNVLDANKGNIIVIDGNTDTIVQTIPILVGERFLGNTAKSIAVNEITNKIYSVNGKNQIIVVDENNNSTTINVGKNPVSLAIDELNNKIYVANFDSNDVTLIDGATNTVTSTIPVGKEPSNIAINKTNKTVYVISRDISKELTLIDSNNSTTTLNTNISPNNIFIDEADNKVYLSSLSAGIAIIDGADNKIREIIIGNEPFAIALNKQIKKLYALNRSASTIVVLDLEDENNLVTLSLGLRFTDIAISQKTNKLYISSGEFSNDEPKLITIIDSNKIVSSEVTLPPFVGTFVLEPSNNRLYVNSLDKLLVIDLDSKKIIQTLDLSGSLAINNVTKKLYLAKDSLIKVLDINSSQVMATVKIKDENEFFSSQVLIKINENTNQIYILVNDTSVTNSATNKSFLAIVDGQTNTLLNKIKLNNETRNFEINMLTNKIYITKRNGEISVVNGNTGNIVTTINTDKNPRNIVVNNKTNRIYVINPNKGLINVINGKTDVLLTKIRVAGRPVTILVNENINQIYVPENREVIAFIDGDTNQIVDRIKVGGNIVHLSLNKVTNNIYAIDNNNPIGKAIVINAIKKNIVSTFKLGVSPSKAEVNEITNKAYIINWLSDTLSEIILPNN